MFCISLLTHLPFCFDGNIFMRLISHLYFADVIDEDMDGAGPSDGEAAGSRAGRFRVSSTNSGPPETTLGRFRLVPQGNYYYIIIPIISSTNTLSSPKINNAGNYGPTSPCLQRGRFAVIPEEPHSGSAAATAATTASSSAAGSSTEQQQQRNNGGGAVPKTTGKSAKRSPSPDWDFDTDVSIYIFC